MSYRLVVILGVLVVGACGDDASAPDRDTGIATTSPTDATTATATDSATASDTAVTATETFDDVTAATEVADDVSADVAEVTGTCGDGLPDPDEDCDDGNGNDLDGCDGQCHFGPIVRAPVAGEVIITELMIDAGAVADPRGEWIELTSIASEVVNLGGCELRDEGTDVVVFDPDGLDLRIASNEALVVGASADDNGGYVADFVYTTMLLDNVSDEVALVCDGVVIDRVAWTPFVWPVVAGRALALDPTRTDALDNDTLGSWCLAERVYGDGDRGTPGAANPSCPQLDTAIDGCKLLGPADVSGFAGAPVSLAVEVREAGVTDATDGVDLVPTLVVEVGWGPSGAPAEGLAWTWTRADGDEAIAVAAGADGYRGMVVVDAVGSVDVLGRASRDGGETWRLCDRSGALPAQPATLTLATSPCGTTSCVTPPAATCGADGVTLHGFEGLGTCTPTSAVAFTCAYEPAVSDCGASGLTCSGGACDVEARAPVTGDVVFTEVMLTPTGGSPMRQWLELESQSDEPLALTGCVIEAADPNGVAPFTLTQATVIGRGGRVVIGASTDLLDNGGAPVQRAWGEAVVLGASEGTLELRCDGVIIDYFGWDAPAWPVTTGAALALSPYRTSVAGNDVPTAWCAAQASFGAGDRGTPGAANPACPGDVAPVTSCSFVGAIPSASPAGTTAVQGVRVVASGITTKTTKTDPSPKLVIETGLAARGAGAASVTSWSAAAPDLAWQVPSGQGVEAGEDRYLARVRVPPPGSWDLFVRATADGGNTWLVCDPTHPVALEPVASICEPDPCGAPPAAGCSVDGGQVVVFGAPSECTLAEGSFTCHFAETAGDDCAAAGALCEDGMCTRFPRAPLPGEVIISELLIAPSPTTTELSEWLELQSTSVDPIDLADCGLRSGGVGADESWSMPPPPTNQPLQHVIMPGAAAVIARSSIPNVNGSTTPIAVWTNLGLGNDADWVALVCGGVVIDTVAWDLADGWVVPALRTLQLSSVYFDGHDNDFAPSWCAPGVATPNVPNLVCPSDDAVLEGCELDADASMTVAADASLILSVIVRDDGVTDLTPGPDPAFGTRVELGIGPDTFMGDPLAVPEWLWLEAEPDLRMAPDGWDRWSTPWTAGVVARVGLVARVSLDGGETWSVCDRSGLDDGFALDARVTTTATACIPNPCRSTAAPTCSGGSLLADADPGACTIEDGAASCAYTTIAFSCGPFGGCNINGTCNSPPGPPAAEGDLVFTEVMRDSTLGAPDLGEWVELTNPKATPFDLRGCTLSDGFGELVTVTRPLPDVVPAGGWAVFARATDKAVNGGVQPTSGALRSLGEMTLANAADTLVLTCNGVEIDRLAWGLDWPGQTGQAMQLDRTKVTAAQNDLRTSWCPSVAGYGTSGNKGSPGLNNILCPP